MLGRYALRERFISTENALVWLVARPAEHLRVLDRGWIALGLRADLVLLYRLTIASYRVPIGTDRSCPAASRWTQHQHASQGLSSGAPAG